MKKKVITRGDDHGLNQNNQKAEGLLVVTEIVNLVYICLYTAVIVMIVTKERRKLLYNIVNLHQKPWPMKKGQGGGRHV